jgi:hypothetical protein
MAHDSSVKELAMERSKISSQLKQDSSVCCHFWGLPGVLDYSVNIEARLWADNQGIRFSAEARDIGLLHIVQTSSQTD